MVSGLEIQSVGRSLPRPGDKASENTPGIISAIQSSNYPAAVKHALNLAGLLEVGSLDVLMPDGRVFSFSGSEVGPHAEMIIRNLAFAGRCRRRRELLGRRLG